jgi:hypothetical protein
MFRLQNYNEFKDSVRQHDYFSIKVNEFMNWYGKLAGRYEWQVYLSTDTGLKFISGRKILEWIALPAKEAAKVHLFKNVLTKCTL